MSQFFPSLNLSHNFPNYSHPGNSLLQKCFQPVHTLPFTMTSATRLPSTSSLSTSFPPIRNHPSLDFPKRTLQCRERFCSFAHLYNIQGTVFQRGFDFQLRLSFSPVETRFVIFPHAWCHCAEKKEIVKIVKQSVTKKDFFVYRLIYFVTSLEECSAVEFFQCCDFIFRIGSCKKIVLAFPCRLCWLFRQVYCENVWHYRSFWGLLALRCFITCRRFST